MKRVSWSFGSVGGFYLIAAHGAKDRARGPRSFSRRPRSSNRKHEPAQNQKRAARGRGERKQAVPGKMPQAQIAGKQACRDNEAEGS
jgi:hypothetical protein